MKDKKIIVTGGMGYIGSHTVVELIKSGSSIGNSGKSYKFRESFALETQHFPDSPNRPNFPTIELNPGETYSTKSIYKFLIK